MPTEQTNLNEAIAATLFPRQEASGMPNDEATWHPYAPPRRFPALLLGSLLAGFIFVACMIGPGLGKRPPMEVGAIDVEQGEYVRPPISTKPDAMLEALVPSSWEVIPVEPDLLLPRRPSSPPIGGSGRGGSGGPGFGPDDGPDTAANRRTRRKDRWEIILPMADSGKFRRELGELQSILMVPEGPGKFRFFDMTQKNPQGKPASIVDVQRLDRIWYTNRVAIVCQGIADELDLPARPDFFAIFLPKDLEEAMAKAELAHAKRTEKELQEGRFVTKFAITRVDDKWQVIVKSQAPRDD